MNNDTACPNHCKIPDPNSLNCGSPFLTLQLMWSVVDKDNDTTLSQEIIIIVIVGVCG